MNMGWMSRFVVVRQMDGIIFTFDMKKTSSKT